MSPFEEAVRDLATFLSRNEIKERVDVIMDKITDETAAKTYGKQK